MKDLLQHIISLRFGIQKVLAVPESIILLGNAKQNAKQKSFLLVTGNC